MGFRGKGRGVMGYGGEGGSSDIPCLSCSLAPVLSFNVKLAEALRARALFPAGSEEGAQRSDALAKHSHRLGGCCKTGLATTSVLQFQVAFGVFNIIRERGYLNECFNMRVDGPALLCAGSASL